MLKVERLKEILEGNGQSQTWLASKIDISPATLSRYLNHKEKASKKIALAIERVLSGFIPNGESLWEEPTKKAS